MRRAALQAFRSARRPAFRKFTRSRNAFITASNNATGWRLLTTRRERAISPLVLSSMQFRNLSVALLSTVVASGAYWTYKVTQGNNPASAASFSNLTNPKSNVYSTSPQTGPDLPSPSATTRRALVVEQGQLYSGTITGDGPLQKDTDDYGRKILEMMTPEQATAKLRKNEKSWLVGRGKGVVRYDVVQIPSNDPIEDDHSEKIIEVPNTVAATDGASNSDWMFWGVFDGHSGWTTSAKLRQVLISFVARELNSTYKAALKNQAASFPTPESIDQAIKNGFIRLDNEIVHESVSKVFKSQSKLAAAELLAPALSGSCALLSFYDSQSKLLRVACTGDSRAVLGRRGANGKWTATPLSEDQTGGTASEAARMRKEHPGEPNVVMNGRVLGGLEPTRAFGDAVYKWSIATQERIKKSFFGRSASPFLKTPPYVTAEPVVTTTRVRPEDGDFVVMATDGLWEMLTNEEVVGLVAQWLETQAGDKKGAGQGAADSWLKSWFSAQKASLPVEQKVLDGGSSGQRAPIRQVQWGMQGGVDERFVVEDKNAATHLVRNALGGRDRDQVCALLTLPSPYSRRYRDDLTVEVIFFGEDDKSGNVTLNVEASATGPELKAKL